MKTGHKEEQLHTFTAAMLTNTKGSLHSPVQCCSTQPDVIYSEILTASNVLKISLLAARTFLSHAAGQPATGIL